MNSTCFSLPNQPISGQEKHDTLVWYILITIIIIIMKAIKTNDNCYDYKVLLVIYFKL